MASSPPPSIVFQAQAQRGFQRGVNQIAELVRPTLGPHARAVAVERTIRTYSPSLLDDSGVIARRIIQLADRDEDTGAMFLRHVLWSTHERVGDGVATTAILFQAVFNAGVRYLAAGGDAMQLRRQLERGMHALLAEIARVTVPLDGKIQLAQLAESVCHEPELAHALGEMFGIIGADGQLDIRAGRRRETEREYVEGRYWNSALLSPTVLHDLAVATLRLKHAGILISDCAIDDPAELLPVLQQARAVGHCALIIVAQRISEQALSVLAANRAAMPTVVVQTPGVRPDEQLMALEDLALLAGGRALVQAAGDRLSRVRAKDLGFARRAWADKHNFGIAGGAGDARQLRAQLARLRQVLAAEQRPSQRDAAQQRIGRLLGGSATLWVGGATDSEITQRTALATRTARVLRSALRTGVVAGGGSALLNCVPLLQRCAGAARSTDERMAYTILAHAVEAPFRALVANAGYEPAEALARVQNAGVGFDVRSGQAGDMLAAGIADSAGVLHEALQNAISSAALALTIDVVIHPRAPHTATEP